LISFKKYNIFSFLTKDISFWDKIFYLFCLLILFTPPLVFFLYTKGIPIVYHQLNIVLILVLIVSAILNLFLGKGYKILFLIPITIFVAFFLSFLGSFDNIFSYNDFSRFLGLYMSLTAAPFFSVFLLKYYRRKGNIDLFLCFVFYSGLIIAAVNIYMFILLYFGGYSKIFSYTDYLGLGMYVEDLGSYFVRPAGYFFDYHSQYYMPLISLFIIHKNKINISPLGKLLVTIIIFTSILISGVKSAYLTLIVCLFYLLIKRINIVTVLKYSISLMIFFFIIDYFLDSLIYELGYKIVTHDVNIFFEHLTEVPTLLLKEYPSVFLVGGQVDFQNYIYSEVYYVTMLYYIGIIGVFLFFIYPSIYTLIRSKDEFVILVTLIFTLSLVHYYVFRISINVIGTTLFYFYFFNILFYRKPVCLKK
jgi:hypothetical protein